MKTLDHTFFNEDRVRDEVAALERYYQENFRPFCEALDITPSHIRYIEPSKLLTIMLMRVYDATTAPQVHRPTNSEETNT